MNYNALQLTQPDAMLLVLLTSLTLLGHLSHSGDLLLSVFVRRRPSSVGRKLLNIFSFFSGTTEPISTRFGL
jgi:hypothetical protein